MFDNLFDVSLLFIVFGAGIMAIYHLCILIRSYLKDWLNE